MQVKQIKKPTPYHVSLLRYKKWAICSIHRRGSMYTSNKHFTIWTQASKKPKPKCPRYEAPTFYLELLFFFFDHPKLRACWVTTWLQETIFLNFKWIIRKPQHECQYILFFEKNRYSILYTSIAAYNNYKTCIWALVNRKSTKLEEEGKKI